MVDLLIHPSLVERPGRILLLAAVLAIPGLLVFVARRLGAVRQLRVWPCLVMSCLWAVYALYEATLQGKGYNIRVELLLIHPALTLLSVLALIATAIPRPRASAGPAGGAMLGGSSERT
ncbi:hypothetical protein ABZV78_06580 [Micromonospora sp. NPDC004540]|uniref:hypothetical protein n=1 Tax=Micromonospora sp. NPDC004540 TaxID=3154457 RepID=UPI0033A45857